jgi:hypothetical protein
MPHQQCALLYPPTIIAEIALKASKTILFFGMLWIITRLMTKYAYFSMALTVILVVSSMDFMVVGWIANRSQKLYLTKNPFRTQAFVFALSILTSRSIGPLLFSVEERVHWSTEALFILRTALRAFLGTVIAGMRYLPYLGYSKQNM